MTRGDLLAGAGLSALPAALFAPSLAGDRLPAGLDLVFYTYPYREAAARALRSGRIPLWNPDIFDGAPFLANIPSAVLYPLNLIYLVPGPRLLVVSMVLHLALAGIAFLVFARVALGTGTAAAAAGALCYAAGGFAIVRTDQLNQNNAMPWIPLLILGLDQAHRRRSPPWAAVLAVALALEVLAGHPQEVYYTALIAGAWLLGLAWNARTEGLASARRLLWPAAGTVTGLLLAGAQLLPTLELSRQSIRAQGLSAGAAGAFGLPVHGLLLYLLPDYETGLHTEFAAYVGAVGLVLALCGWLAASGDARLLLTAALGGVAVVLALGDQSHAYAFAYRWLPGLASFRAPSRIVLDTTFALSMLAAWGLQRLRWGIGLAGGVTLLAAFGGAHLLQSRGQRSLHGLLNWFPEPVQPRQVGMLAALLAIATAAGLLLRGRPAALRLSLALLLGLELAVAARPMNTLNPLPAAIYSTAPLIALPSDSSGGRGLSIGRGVDVIMDRAGRDPRDAELTVRSLLDFPNLPTGSGEASADGYEGGILPLGRYLRLRAAMFEPGRFNPGDFPIWLMTDRPGDPRLLALQAVQTVVITSPDVFPIAEASGYRLVASRGGARAYAVPGARPLAYFPDRVAPAGDDPEASLRAFPDTALLEGPACGAAPGAVAGRPLVAPERIAVQVSGGGGLLVIASAWYPGWVARVDGHALPLQPVDLALSGLCVPPGTHTVELTYEPASWRNGVLASAVGALALLGLLLYGRIRSTRSRTRPANASGLKSRARTRAADASR